MLAEPGTYPNAEKLMDALKAKNIDCSAVHGGVKIYPTDDYQANDAKVICAELGIYCSDSNQSFAVLFRDAWRLERGQNLIKNKTSTHTWRSDK